MTGVSFAAITENCTKAAELAATLYLELNSVTDQSGRKLDFEKTIPGTDVSTHDLNKRLTGALGLCGRFKRGHDLSLIPTPFVTEVVGALSDLANVLDENLNKLDVVKKSDGYGSIDNEQIVVTSGNNSRAFGLQELVEVNARIDLLLGHVYRLLAVLEPKEFDAFAGATSQAQKFLDGLTFQQSNIEDLRKKVATEAEVAANLKTQIEGIEKETGGLRDQAKKAAEATTTSEDKAREDEIRARETVEKTTQLAAAADALNKQVEGAKQRFIEFDDQIKERSKNHSRQKGEAGKLIDDLSGLRDSVAGLESKGQKMLGLTTAAALAVSFKEARSDLESPLRNAHGFFYISLLILFLLVLIAVGGVPGLVDLPTIGSASSGEATFLTVLASASIRFLILLPGIILVTFMARRHKALFRLRELYNYKYTIAMSVPGFKEESSDQAGAIAAAAYEQLLFNPAAYLEDEIIPKRRSGILSRWLTAIVKKAFEDLRVGNGPMSGGS
jgi:hypothetical protein